MKIIQIPIDERLLARLDAEARREGKSRAALMREAAEDRLRRRLRDRLDEVCVAAYRRRPVRRGEFPPVKDPDWDFGDRW